MKLNKHVTRHDEVSNLFPNGTFNLYSNVRGKMAEPSGNTF